MWNESDEANKPLRSGLTTGCCATACCVAAAHLLLADSKLDIAFVTLPRGKEVQLTISELHKTGNIAFAATVKDAGDDPDVTHGATVFVELQLIASGISFVAGTGVGTATREGLALAVGEPAINPVPRQMMRDHLQSIAKQYGYKGGFEITVGVVGGEQLALKTMNPRLGILGGLSILGTTGIVRPFSCSAYIASIHQGIDVAKANGISHIAATTGSSSEAAIRSHYGFEEMALIEMGDFVGAVLKYLRKQPIAKLSICGGFGKISKLANGHLDLHSRASSIDFEHLASLAATAGATNELQAKMLVANTSIEALNLCADAGIELAQLVCESALRKAKESVPDSVEIEVWATNRKGELIANAVGSSTNGLGPSTSAQDARTGQTLLLLGGTADARRLAKLLSSSNKRLIYSVAGLVRRPDVDCEIVSGGFSQFGGLASFIRERAINGIIDATHPYASTMTATAQQVCESMALPYWRFQRPAWQAKNGDNWVDFADWPSLMSKVAEKKSVFLSAGQLSKEVIAQFSDISKQTGQRQVLRTAAPAQQSLPPSMTWVKAIGPFSLEDELALLKQYQIDLIVSKNSGGDATSAKLAAARQLEIPVWMLERPPTPEGLTSFDDLDACYQGILAAT